MKSSRVSFWLSLLLLVSSGSLEAADGDGNAKGKMDSLEALRAARKQAAERQRRIIFNNDGNEPVYLCENTTAEELLRHRTAALAGSKVDSLFYCTWSSGFGLFTHDTKVGQVFSTKEALFSKNKTPELLAAGTDPLRVMTEFGHANGMEVMWSFRLNDTHDGSGAAYGPVMFRANRLKNEHPEWLISTKDVRPRYGACSAVDFTRSEIRDLAFRFVEEVCQNYDVDGVEIDFFRHPVFFKRAAMTGTECTDEERALMTGLIQRIRSMTEEEGMKRGRPILLAVRVPDSVEFCRAVGIDLERWLAGGLLDLLIVSGYFQLNDWNYSVELGQRYGVKVYPSLDESRVKEETARKLRSSIASYRGRALNAWQAGADGLYLFNSFDPRSAIWTELSSPALLTTLDHDYFASVRGLGAAAGGTYPHVEFLQIPDLNPARPVALTPAEPARVTFNVGDDVAAMPSEPTVQLRLQFKTPISPQGVTVKLNGRELGEGRESESWLEFPITVRDLKTGSNEVQIELSGESTASALTDLHCTLRYP